MRKELKAANLGKPETFYRECRVLSFLNCLEHPNIVELLGSYTCDGIHSLLFPVASGDLLQMLRSPEHPDFKSEADYIFALCGLASGMYKLHNFCLDEFSTRLIGCHHDIKPQNILVQDGKLLLADFGLSNFKDVAQSSDTSFKIGDGRYMAPECEDPAHDFKPGRIGRKSDIWSFGCVVVELLTYMTRGPAGVLKFQESRRVTVAERFTSFAFHAGRQPNPGVEAWLDQMQLGASPSVFGLVQLVRDMLQVEPKDRPTAEQATLSLGWLALESHFRTVSASYGMLARGRTNLDLLIEKERFSSWGYHLGMTQFGERKASQTHNALGSDAFFSRQFENMSSIANEIALELHSEDEFHARVVRLRMINDDMLQVLPHPLQVSINSKLEQNMVGTEDLDMLHKVKESFDESSKYRSIGTLAAVKYMHRLCETPPAGYGRRMQLQSVSWKSQKCHDHFEVGMMLAPSMSEPGRVLVEKIKYEEHWVGKVGDELFSRIGAIAELLRFVSRSDNGMRVLSPIGYFHDVKNCAFALAFRIPPHANSSEDETTEVLTLREYMEETQRPNLSRPSLAERLTLARRIISALVRIHKASWLHKNISAFTIIFPRPKHLDRSPTRIPVPFIIGFNHSRPNDPNSFSNETEYSLDVTDYRHPEYLQGGNRVRYQIKFDYFSLGLVLLEIGLWRPLDRLTKGKQGIKPEALANFILEECVPQLDFYVGVSYRDMVNRCLTGEPKFGPPDSTWNTSGSESPDCNFTVEE